MLTLERLFSGVCSFMCLQCTILGEAFRTVMTSVRPLSCVLIHVCLKIAVLCE